MKTVLISFATNDKWYKSQNLLNESSIKCGINHYISYNPNNLDQKFKEDYKHLLRPDVGGHGGWIREYKKAMKMVQRSLLGCDLEICKETEVIGMTVK